LQGLSNPRRLGPLPHRGPRGNACAARALIRGTSSARPPAVRAGSAGWMASCCGTRCASMVSARWS
jgi:hypothetical protein